MNEEVGAVAGRAGGRSLPRLSLAFDGESSVEHCLGLAVAAEKAGFARLWFSENPFGRSIVPTLTLCAQATQRIGLGAGVFTPFARHPLLIAAEAKALDEVSGGRFAVGIGSGATQARQFGLAAKPAPTLRDAVTILRTALTARHIDYAGDAFSAHDVPVSGELRPAIPVYVAAMGPRAIRIAADLGDGLLISDMCPPAYTRWAVDQAVRSRRQSLEVTQIIPCSVHSDSAAAHRQVKTSIGKTLLMLVDHLTGGYPAVTAALRDFSGIPGTEFDIAMARLRVGEHPTDVLDERYVAAYSVAGTPEQCLNRLRVMRESGVTEAALIPIGPDGAHQLGLLAAAATSGAHA